MIRSNAVDHVKPSSSCRTALIWGMGNVFLTICLFPKIADNPHGVFLLRYYICRRSQFRMRCRSNNPKSHNLWISFCVISYAFGDIDNGRPCYGLLLLLVKRIPAHNPSHLVSCQTAHQFLVGSSVMIVFPGR